MPLKPPHPLEYLFKGHNRVSLLGTWVSHANHTAWETAQRSPEEKRGKALATGQAPEWLGWHPRAADKQGNSHPR